MKAGEGGGGGGGGMHREIISVLVSVITSTLCIMEPLFFIKN